MQKSMDKIVLVYNIVKSPSGIIGPRNHEWFSSTSHTGNLEKSVSGVSQCVANAKKILLTDDVCSTLAAPLQ